jgi:alkylated DNA repair dioxygenase AlkB
MSQLSLFESVEAVLVDDASGRIVYSPRFVSADRAGAWFAELREDVAWKAERRPMYDREVDVPRLTAHFPLDEPESAPALPDAILRAAEQVVTRTGVPFNGVGLNRYRDGRDSVAPHNDHLHALVRGFPIALLSLGSTRRMTIRAKQPPRARVPRRARERQPLDDELRDAAALHTRHPEDERPRRRAHQPRVPREAGARRRGRARRRLPLSGQRSFFPAATSAIPPSSAPERIVYGIQRKSCGITPIWNHFAITGTSAGKLGGGTS